MGDCDEMYHLGRILDEYDERASFQAPTESRSVDPEAIHVRLLPLSSMRSHSRSHPDAPLPNFHTTPKVVMVTPIYAYGGPLPSPLTSPADEEGREKLYTSGFNAAQTPCSVPTEAGGDIGPINSTADIRLALQPTLEHQALYRTLRIHLLSLFSAQPTIPPAFPFLQTISRPLISSTQRPSPVPDPSDRTVTYRTVRRETHPNAMIRQPQRQFSVHIDESRVGYAILWRWTHPITTFSRTGWACASIAETQLGACVCGFSFFSWTDAFIYGCCGVASWKAAFAFFRAWQTSGRCERTTMSRSGRFGERWRPRAMLTVLCFTACRDDEKSADTFSGVWLLVL
ncbi:hypothetical protein BKA70DRAFT_1298420 [Coprinopsis sp. MPI-PUGE-AT-0042]|nr:hypothetical protein BKA70DRAFT_1298420 [Coprinopsis sp. MPI-PUGE-AT-0042]